MLHHRRRDLSLYKREPAKTQVIKVSLIHPFSPHSGVCHTLFILYITGCFFWPSLRRWISRSMDDKPPPARDPPADTTPADQTPSNRPADDQPPSSDPPSNLSRIPDPPWNLSRISDPPSNLSRPNLQSFSEERDRKELEYDPEMPYPNGCASGSYPVPVPRNPVPRTPTPYPVLPHPTPNHPPRLKHGHGCRPR